jgi:hypothetical protein
VAIEIEADLGFEAPFGPGRVLSEGEDIVIRVGGLRAALSALVWFARRGDGWRLRRTIRRVARASRQTIVLELGEGGRRIRLAKGRPGGA